MTIKGIYFDLYGTLFTFGDMQAELEEWLSEFYKCLEKYGLKIAKDSFKEYYRNQHSMPKAPKPKEGLTIFESRIQLACSDLDVEIPIEGIKDTAHYLFNVFNRYINLDKHCISVLNTLKQRTITLGLISNFDHPPQVRELISSYGLDKYFATIVISGEVGINKPNPSIFHLALKETECNSQNAIFVGDSEEDIVGANAAGMMSVLIDRSGRRKNFGQIKTISSLQDVLHFS